jgi:hypothetical protein
MAVLLFGRHPVRVLGFKPHIFYFDSEGGRAGKNCIGAFVIVVPVTVIVIVIAVVIIIVAAVRVSAVIVVAEVKIRLDKRKRAFKTDIRPYIAGSKNVSREKNNN